MKNVLFLFTFLMSFNIAHAEENNMTNNTLRLIYPQWQGGYIAQWIEEVKLKTKMPLPEDMLLVLNF